MCWSIGCPDVAKQIRSVKTQFLVTLRLGSPFC